MSICMFIGDLVLPKEKAKHHQQRDLSKSGKTKLFQLDYLSRLKKAMTKSRYENKANAHL